MIRTALASVLAAAALATPALASAPPVGPLPAGPTRTIVLRVGHSVRLSLPKPTVAGRVWRVARAFDGRVVREVVEGESATTVWAVYQGMRPGSTRVIYAQTRGERAHAYAARRFLLRVVR
jgi:hypothetical protein